MKAEVYERITAQIVARMETCGSDWLPSWTNGGYSIMPSNPVSKWKYRGLNTLMLWLEQQQRSYRLPLWATYKQWSSIGAQVDKGQKGTMIMFYKKYEAGKDANGDPEIRSTARVSWVFNAAQVSGWIAPVQIPVPIEERDQTIDAFITGTGANIETSEAFSPSYIPSLDVVRMPRWRDYPSINNWYVDTFHELGHWTGHSTRLDRDLKSRFHLNSYAAEELVAELTAAFLAGNFGMAARTRDDHAKYINNWIKMLKDDPRAIITASKLAADAAEYLLAAASMDVVENPMADAA